MRVRGRGSGPGEPMPERPEGIETSVDRRRSQRVPLEVRVEYTTVDALFSEFTRNVNEGGLFVETERPAPIDSRVTLRFALPGSPDPVKVDGLVVRVSSGQAGEPPGMAIEFEQLDPEARQRINEAVRRLRSR